MMHIGTVRTALFNYLFAKHNGGTYFVRIEDTDKERNKSEWVDAIWEDFEWCGLRPDMKYVQSEHLPRHRELLHGLVESGKAYISKEPSQADSTKTVEVVRLRNPGATVTFKDLIRGDVTFDTTELGDFVIARSIDDPLYHFAVVADDEEAGVTHVIRAEEHISNTPRQILIQEALGFSRPDYAHIPLILAPDKSKLSKRKHGAAIENYRERGFLPEAIINYLALLGWNPGTDEEMFSLQELVTRFSLDQVQRSGAVFDETKLKWFNREYILKLSDNDFSSWVERYLSKETTEGMKAKGVFTSVLPLMKERIHTFGELRDMDAAGEWAYFASSPSYDPAALVPKKGDKEGTKTRLEGIADRIGTVTDWNPESVKAAVWDYAESEGRGNVLWPMRYALSGKDKSPDPFTIAGIIGKDETRKRIQHAIDSL